MNAPQAKVRRRRSVVPPARHAPDDGVTVQDGDILLWRGTYTVSRAFELLSRSWYSHVAFIIHWEGYPMVLQASAFGIQAVPYAETIRRYHGLVDWYRLKEEARADLKLPRTIEQATCNLGRPFGLPNALRELVYRWTGIALFRKNPKARSGMFCAEYVSKCFKAGGLDLLPDKEDVHTFPDDIAQNEELLHYRCTIYDTRRRKTAAPPGIPDPQLSPATVIPPTVGVPVLPIGAGANQPAATVSSDPAAPAGSNPASPRVPAT